MNSTEVYEALTKELGKDADSYPLATASDHAEAERTGDYTKVNAAVAFWTKRYETARATARKEIESQQNPSIGFNMKAIVGPAVIVPQITKFAEESGILQRGATSQFVASAVTAMKLATTVVGVASAVSSSLDKNESNDLPGKVD